MEERYRESAERIRSLVANGLASPAVVREALTIVPGAERDGWVDRLLGIDSIPADGPELPPGGVPYLPCPVDALLRMMEHAGVQSSDVFVDIGSGVGRAAALVHLLTGAESIGIEVQPGLARASRDLADRLNLACFSTIVGDAAALAGTITKASVFFFYCSFSGGRLEKALDAIEPLAQARQIRFCCVDLPLPPRPWLTLASPPSGDLVVYRSAPRRPGLSGPTPHQGGALGGTA